MATAASSRPHKRTRTNASRLETQRNSLSRNLLEENTQTMLTMPPTSVPESWASFDLEKMLGQTGTPSAFLPDPSTYDFSTQSAQDSTLMADFFQNNPAYSTPKQMAFDQSMWDYFTLDDTHSSQIVAPQDLSTFSTTTTTTLNPAPQPQQKPAAPVSDPPKQAKKRGRKRKQLDAKAQVEERKKFLERNRVAANRCRERKKSYVSNLESKQKDVLSRNQFLRRELETLSEEVALLKQLVHVECACSEQALEQNLRVGLRESTQSNDEVEEVVAKFKIMRATGVTAGTGMDALMKEIVAGSPSSATSSSVHDDLFSLLGEGDEEGESSTQSSPIETSEGKESGYPTL